MSNLELDYYLKHKVEAEKLEVELEPQLAPLKNQINEINKKINSVESEQEDLEKQRRSCQKKFSDIKSKYKKEMFAYMQKKIRSERMGKKTIVPFEEDDKIVEVCKKIESSEQERDAALKEFDEPIASKKTLVSQLKSERKPIEEEVKRISAPLKEAKKSRDLWKWAWDRAVEKECESSRSSDAYSTDSSSSSYISAEQAVEEFRKQTSYAQQQAEEARKQTELARRQMEQERHEAMERRFEENRRKRAQEEAISSRCRTCAVVGCGMRFNKSNVNCAGYRPKR